jgi:hypothetical protein
MKTLVSPGKEVVTNLGSSSLPKSRMQVILEEESHDQLDEEFGKELEETIIAKTC